MVIEYDPSFSTSNPNWTRCTCISPDSIVPESVQVYSGSLSYTLRAEVIYHDLAVPMYHLEGLRTRLLFPRP